MSKAKYLIIESYQITEMTRQVQRLLAEGWALQGGVSIAVDGANCLRYAQALTRAAAGTPGEGE